MIIGTLKPFPELLDMIAPFRRILALGCGTCVTICHAGGDRQIEEILEMLRISRGKSAQGIETTRIILRRQCDTAFADDLPMDPANLDAILSFGCAAGLPNLISRFPKLPVIPAINTQCIGSGEGAGRWVERCIGCGDCFVHLTAGICVLTRCPKGMLNEPCGAETESGSCDAIPAQTCVWLDIARRWKQMGTIQQTGRLIPMRNWSVSHSGGYRTICGEMLE